MDDDTLIDQIVDSIERKHELARRCEAAVRAKDFVLMAHLLAESEALMKETAPIEKLLEDRINDLEVDHFLKHGPGGKDPY